MTALALAAAVSIAFPREGQSLPYVTRCYVIGSASDGATNVVVQGANVPVHPKGGWVTMVNLAEGINVVTADTSTVSFKVDAKPKPVSDASATNSAAKPPVKKYGKLSYAGDNPKAHPRGKKPEDVTVVIDAGHGGSDTGAWSPHGLNEKDVNLLVAKAVKAALERRGYKVVMTREDDSFPALYDRPKVAHGCGADAFISIHHNAPPLDKDPRTLRYHAIYAWNEIGVGLATALNKRLAETFGNTLANNGVPHANFAVTRNPEIPSCLVEVDFITTPEGEIDCWDRARQKRVAEAVATGFDDWVEPQTNIIQEEGERK